MNADVKAEDISVRIAESQTQKAAVQEFMREHALRTHGCEPPPSLGIILGAWFEGKVVGSVVLDLRQGGEFFPLEELYGTAAVACLFPEGFERSRIVQGGRWFSALPRSPVSRLMARAFAEVALEHDTYAMFSEAKEYAFRRMREWGFCITCNLDARADISRVQLAGREYYETQPFPCLFRMELSSMR